MVLSTFTLSQTCLVEIGEQGKFSVDFVVVCVSITCCFLTFRPAPACRQFCWYFLAVFANYPVSQPHFSKIYQNRYSAVQVFCIWKMRCRVGFANFTLSQICFSEIGKKRDDDDVCVLMAQGQLRAKSTKQK